VTPRGPLYEIASEIRQQDRASSQRRRWKRFLGEYWGWTLLSLVGASVLLVLVWPLFVAVTKTPVESMLARGDWFIRSGGGRDWVAPRLIELPDTYLAAPLTIPIIVLGALVALRQSVLGRIKQIADDKQSVRWRTLDHLRHTVEVFRKDENEFMADLAWMYRHRRRPRMELFDAAIRFRVAKEHPAIKQDSDAFWREYDRVIEVIASPTHAVVQRAHGRPRVNPELVKTIMDYFPLFSFVWGHLMNHEQLGLGVARKCYGIKTLDGMSGPQIVDTYNTWKCFIDRVRQIDGYRTAFGQFQWLASMIVMLRASRSVARFHGIPIVSLDHPADSHNSQWLWLATRPEFYPDSNRAYYRPRLPNAISAIMKHLVNERKGDARQRLCDEVEGVRKAIREQTPSSDQEGQGRGSPRLPDSDIENKPSPLVLVGDVGRADQL